MPSVGATFQNTAPAMNPFPVMEDDNVKVSAILVPHYDVFPSFAFRFDIANGKSIVFSGDTRKSDNVAKLAAGCDLLVHESYYLPPSSARPNPDVGGAGGSEGGNADYMRLSHTLPDEAGSIASAAGARSLVLSHITPGGVPDDKWKAAVAATYRGPVTVAADLQRFSLD